jgi:hypothetical protein
MLSRERNAKVLVLIPILLDDSLSRWESGKASILQDRVAADFRRFVDDPSACGSEFAKLRRALLAENARVPAPEPKL